MGNGRDEPPLFGPSPGERRRTPESHPGKDLERATAEYNWGVKGRKNFRVTLAFRTPKRAERFRSGGASSANHRGDRAAPPAEDPGSENASVETRTTRKLESSLPGGGNG